MIRGAVDSISNWLIIQVSESTKKKKHLNGYKCFGKIKKKNLEIKKNWTFCEIRMN